jgi:chromate transporter
VDTHGWLTDERFLDGLAASNALPGPISAKMSVFVGLEVGGIPGAIVSFLAVMVPGVTLMSVLAGLLLRHRDAPMVNGAMAAVQPVVIGLLAWTVLSLLPDGVHSWTGAVLAAGALGAMAMNVHPAVVIAVALGLGAVFLR